MSVSKCSVRNVYPCISEGFILYFIATVLVVMSSHTQVTTVLYNPEDIVNVALLSTRGFDTANLLI